MIGLVEGALSLAGAADKLMAVSQVARIVLRKYLLLTTGAVFGFLLFQWGLIPKSD